MNHEYYRQVLEDVQQDLANVEQDVSELHGIERYVQRKMETESDNGNSKLSYDQYQALLDDVRQDVDAARSKIGELRGVGNFARQKLKDAGVEVSDDAKPAKAGAKTTAEPKGKPEDTPKEEKSGMDDTMQTVQFGPDGFPIGK